LLKFVFFHHIEKNGGLVFAAQSNKKIDLFNLTTNKLIASFGSHHFKIKSFIDFIINNS